MQLSPETIHFIEENVHADVRSLALQAKKYPQVDMAMAVVQIACGDLSHHIVYGLMVIVASVGFDLFFIILSYGLILHAVFRIPSWEARGKAFSTCGSHLCVIALFYSPVIFSVLAQVLGYHMAPHLQIIIDNLYFLVPPMINPLIYGARTKQMREWVLRIFHCQGD